MPRIWKSVEIDIDLDEADIADLSEKELAAIGLYRATASTGAPSSTGDQWQAVRLAILDGDHHRLLSLLNDMAWAQAGLMLPVVPRLKAVS